MPGEPPHAAKERVMYVHLSDIHLDSRRQLAGALRLTADGTNEALASTVRCWEHVISEGVRLGPPELWLIAGDVFDRPSPSQDEEAVAVQMFDAMARHAPVVVIAGNHDVPSTAARATALEALKRRARIHVVEQPDLLLLGDTVVACVPYPRRGELVHMEGASREERNAAASEALRTLVGRLRVAAHGTAATRRVLLYHGSISGARVGHQPRSLSGDVVLSAGDLAGWHYVACGHIHGCQQMAPSVWYAGSIDRVDFAEERDVKCALIIDFGGDGEVPRVASIRTPAREYQTLSGPADSLATRVVYRVKASCAPHEAAELRRWCAAQATDGAWVAPALTVETEVRARDELARADESPEDLLRRWLRANPEHIEQLAEFGEPGQIREDLLAANRRITA